MEQLILLIALNLPINHPPPAQIETQKFVSLRKGNTAKELLQAFGKPYSISDEKVLGGDTFYTQAIYRNGDLCSGISCSVILVDGKITEFMGVKPEYSYALK